MEHSKENAQSYQRVKVWFSLFNYLKTFILLSIVIFSGLSVFMRDVAQNISSFWIFEVAVYFSLLSVFFLIFDLPLSFYTGYVLEKKYDLTNQTVGAWLKEMLKKSILSFALTLVLLEVFFCVIRISGDSWWWIFWIVWVVISLVLGKLAPVLIFPLFYKFEPLEEGSLKTKILDLVQKGGLFLKNVYVFNMSKTTKKANAAFCGMGKTRRVILADTLIENFTEEEIEMVVAHEMGHCRLKHIWKRTVSGMLVSLVLFYLVSYFLNQWDTKFGFEGIQDVAVLPLIFLIFFAMSLFLIPIENAYSRKHEYEADDYAYQWMPNKQVFASLMEKLGKLNLANPNPHPVIEFLLYDHPSLAHRIEKIQSKKD